MSALPLACKQFVELVTAYFDNALPEADRVRFEAHLAECPHCKRYLNQMQVTVKLVGRLSEAQLPQQVRSHLLECFREWTANA